MAVLTVVTAAGAMVVVTEAAMVAVEGDTAVVMVVAMAVVIATGADMAVAMIAMAADTVPVPMVVIDMTDTAAVVVVVMGAAKLQNSCSHPIRFVMRTGTCC